VSRRKGSVRLAAAACCAVLISLSFSGSAQSSTPRPSGSLVSTALAAWSGFPVQASTRPLVLIDGDDVNAPILGFPNDNTKLAYEDGAIVAPSKYPTAPSFAAGFTLESPQAAFKTLKSIATSGPPATTALVVTAVTLGTSDFQTDRGQRTLPAWLFSLQNVQNPAQVLAVSPSRIFTPPQSIVPDAVPESSSPVESATLATNHRTITVEVAGAPEGTGPCEATYSLSVGTSRTAVAVLVNAVTHYKADIGCLLQASVIDLKTTLARPLGNRVVVNADSLAAVPLVP
jgi:hypothetical protein